MVNRKNRHEGMKKGKRAMKVILGFAIVMGVLLLAIYINHKIQLARESELFIPLGKMVEVDGNHMSVYVEGCGKKTLVFMSGGGTCSPILDFKSLYSLLSDQYRIVVIERFGYGFSDIVDKERDIKSVLDDTREAIKSAGIEAPYILCPHSMSGIEALYWAQQYPDEVLAIIGLDMAVPQAYENYNINMPMLKLTQFAANIGITRIIPNISESDAIKYGTLSDDEKKLYRTIFYRRTATTTMMNEVSNIKENAKIVNELGVPQIPMLLFVSNGIGTGWSKDDWLSFQKNFAESVENGKVIELNCPHYVHNYEYKMISNNIIEFLENIID